MRNEDLILEAKKASLKAYAPYSKFHVGCALKLKSGQIIHGCNVENASYGLCMCAERNALYFLISQGFLVTEVKALAIYANAKQLVSPCGACRQVFVELLSADTKIIMANDKEQLETTVAALLPLSFTGENL